MEVQLAKTAGEFAGKTSVIIGKAIEDNHLKEKTAVGITKLNEKAKDT